MKNIVNHRDIDKKLRKLAWISTEVTSKKISPYAAYGDPNVGYGLTQLDTFENVDVIDENGKKKTVRMHNFRIEKLLPNGERVRLKEKPLGKNAAMRLGEKDYLLRHKNFMLTWDEPSWKSRWAAGLAGKIPSRIQLGTILTASYNNNPTIRIELIAAPQNGFALRAKFFDNSELPIQASAELDVFYDIKDLAPRVNKFQETVAEAFKKMMIKNQMEQCATLPQDRQKLAPAVRPPQKRAAKRRPFQWPER